jgi:hypothetical protein
MKSKGVKYGLGTGVFLMGLMGWLLAAPGPAGANGFTHANQHGSFRHAFQQHRFGHSGLGRHPGFFRHGHGFGHDRFGHGHRFHRDRFQGHHKFHPHGFQHRGFHGGSGIIFIWR